MRIALGFSHLLSLHAIADLASRATAIPLGANSGLTNPDNECITDSLSLMIITVSKASILEASSATSDNSSVSFQVTNAVRGVKIQCSGQGPGLTPKGPKNDPNIWYPCPTEGNMTTRFQYDSNERRITVDEVWVCNSTAPNPPCVTNPQPPFSVLDIWTR